jgi:hypothetical protein
VGLPAHAIFAFEPTGSGENMIRKLALLFAIGAFVLAAAESYKVTLFQPTVVQGKELKPGSYKLDVRNNVLVIANGKESVETPVKIETNAQKFSSTTVRFATAEGKYSIQEIRLGGTKTRLVFNP